MKGSDDLKIGFTGVGRGCGTSALAAAFGEYLSEERKEQVTLCQPFQTSLFDGLGMEQKFAARGFVSFLRRAAEGESVRGVRNIDKKVNWLLKSAVDSKINISLRELLRIAYGLEGDQILMDMSGWQEIREQISWRDVWDVLGEMDRIVAVIDPLPSRMIPGHELLMKLKASGRDVIYVVNKNNQGVPMRQVSAFLKVKNLTAIPDVNFEKTYEAEYLGLTLYDKRIAKDSLKPCFEQLERALFC